MTRAGAPTSRMYKTLLPKVLGPDFPKDFAYGGRRHTVSPWQTDLLASLVEERAEHLRHCARLHAWITIVIREFAGGKGLSPALKKVRDEWAPLTLELWSAGVDTIEGVRECVGRTLESSRVILKDLTAEPEFVRELQANLDARWPAPTPSRPPSSSPLGKAYFHNDVPEETWEDAVSWVRDHEDWGWAEEMQLVGDVTRRPLIQEPNSGARPLDRSVEARLVKQLRPDNQLSDLRELDPEAALRREIECAVSPLGVATVEARTVLMLGFWLVNNRDFGVTPGERRARPEHPSDDDPTSLEVAAEHNELAAYHALLPRVWRNIRQSGARRSENVPDADEHGDLDTDSVGRRRLADPLSSFMKRLWSRVHTYSHWGSIGAMEATFVLQYTWKSWVGDVSTVMTTKPTAPAAKEFQVGRSTLARHVHRVGVSGSAGLELIRRLMSSEDPELLRSEWAVAVTVGGIGERAARASGIGDPVVVRDYLKEQMGLVDDQEGQ